jgi:hypothetical protein
MDSGVLAKVLDDVLAYGGDYRIDRLDVGRAHADESYARIVVSANDDEALGRLLMRLQAHGVNQVDPGEALLREVEQDGVFPDDFYSTTNLETVVRLGTTWVPVEQPEMDCGLLVEGGRVRTVPVSDVQAGQQVVCGAGGVKVVLPLKEHSTTEGSFEFMASRCPARSRSRCCCGRSRSRCARSRPTAARCCGSAARLSCTPVRHRPWSRWSRPATSTCCSPATRWPPTTSRRRCTARRSASTWPPARASSTATSTTSGAINQIRKAGSIAAAVEQGVLTSGVMHAMVTHGKRFVLVGSVRDDGPLPDVHTDVIVGQRAMRAELPGVGFAIMVATMLHSIATGNILPASIPLVCVDINPATSPSWPTAARPRRRHRHRHRPVPRGLARELVPGFSSS